MLSIGFGGLAVNAIAAIILMRSSKESLNTEGAFLHVLSDLLGSIAVVAGGIVIIALGWQIVDPILSVVIGILILASSTRLLWKVMHVLLGGTPRHLNLDMLCSKLEQVEGVTGVHDLHVWSVTSGYEVLTAHITSSLQTAEERDHLLQHLREIASRDFGVVHVTIQLEASEEDCAEDHHVSHPKLLSS
jgi:cobalt-zinc-cadmium efflux system protein